MHQLMIDFYLPVFMRFGGDFIHVSLGDSCFREVQGPRRDVIEVEK